MFADDLSEERKEKICAKIAGKVVQFRMTPAAIVLLEAVKPLSFMGNQLMVILAPVVGAFTSGPLYEELTAFLEKRSNLEMLIRRIEEEEAEYSKERKKRKEAKKKARRRKRG